MNGIFRFNDQENGEISINNINTNYKCVNGRNFIALIIYLDHGKEKIERATAYDRRVGGLM